MDQLGEVAMWDVRRKSVVLKPAMWDTEEVPIGEDSAIWQSRGRGGNAQLVQKAWFKRSSRRRSWLHTGIAQRSNSRCIL